MRISAAAALTAFRDATGWDAPPQLLEIDKRIPVAAGLGGGSADAAAVLRLARAASGLGDEALLRMIAGRLGADVPAQVTPGRWLAEGAGERLERLPAARWPLALLIIPAQSELSTAAVYAEADRLGVPSTHEALAQRSAELRGAFAGGAPLPAARELLHNDLQRPAVSLCPEIAETLALARRGGAVASFVSGSGPTVVSVFAPTDGGDAPEVLAEAARERVAESGRDAILASPVEPGFGEPRSLA